MTGEYPFNRVPLEKIHNATIELAEYRSIMPIAQEIPDNIWTFILKCWEEAPLHPPIDQVIDFISNYKTQDVDTDYL